MEKDHDSGPGSALPECVAEASKRAEELYWAVIDTSFPELPENFDSAREAAESAHAALLWGEKVHQWHDVVMELFPARETGVRMELPPELHPLNWGQTPPSEFFGEIVRRYPQFDVASDVLGPIPAKFEESGVAAFPLELAPYHASNGERVQLMIDILGDDWRSLSPEMIRQWATVVRIKCLGLVGWIREQVAELHRATWPEIIWESSRAHGGQVVRVAMAGASRREDLTGGEHAFLLGLATGSAECYRKDKSNLIRKIPELAPFISAVGSVTETRTKYRIAHEIADRISAAPGS